MGKCLLVKQIRMKPVSSHFPVSEPLLAYRYKLHLVNLTWLEMKKILWGFRSSGIASVKPVQKHKKVLF